MLLNTQTQLYFKTDVVAKGSVQSAQNELNNVPREHTNLTKSGVYSKHDTELYLQSFCDTRVFRGNRW